VWMASYNLKDVAQMWYIQVQRDEGTPSWHHVAELLNLLLTLLHSNSLGKLVACKWTSMLDDFQG
jgi:hypothetical protein